MPYASIPIVEQEVDRLLNLGFIKPVRHADWMAPVMFVKKPDGSSRFCVDYSTGLDDALQLHQHPVRLPEDIFATLSGGSHVFSQIDFSNAHLQMELDDDSKRLCNINTDRGVNEYQWLTLCQQAFKSIKDILNSDPLLTHYGPSLEVIVAADASEHGLGTVIKHRWPDRSVRAIAHASCSLNPA